MLEAWNPESDETFASSFKDKINHHRSKQITLMKRLLKYSEEEVCTLQLELNEANAVLLLHSHNFTETSRERSVIVDEEFRYYTELHEQQVFARVCIKTIIKIADLKRERLSLVDDKKWLQKNMKKFRSDKMNPCEPTKEQ